MYDCLGAWICHFMSLSLSLSLTLGVFLWPKIPVSDIIYLTERSEYVLIDIQCHLLNAVIFAVVTVLNEVQRAHEEARSSMLYNEDYAALIGLPVAE